MELFVDNFNRPGKHAIKYPEVLEIFKYPRCHWYAPLPGKPVKQFESSVRRFMRRAHPWTPAVVLYNIPDRDLGYYSKGGASSNDHYIKYIEQFSRGIEGYQPIVIFEPDALTHAADKPDALERRVELFQKVLPILKDAGALVYIDIGHPRWLGPSRAAEILSLVDVNSYAGFSCNVSNYVPVQECIDWGTQVSNLCGGAHFVIDTSRNGTGIHDNDWCNARNKRLGPKPTLNTGVPLVDAYLWIKVPGESDGYCDGGPKAGIFWPEYAAMLVGDEINQVKFDPNVDPMQN